MKKTEIKQNKQREFDLRGFWIRLWRLLSPSHRQIKILVMVIMVEEVVRLIAPYFLKIIIDLATNFKVEDTPKIAGWVLAMFLANQATSFMVYLADRRILNLIADVVTYLLENAHKKMVFLGLSYHEKENTGNKIVKIQKGVDRIDMLIGNVFWEVCPTIFQAIYTMIILFYIDWRFGLIILIFVPLFILLTISVNKKVFIFRRQRFDKQEEASGVMAQAIININTVKSFVQEKREISDFEKIVSSAKKTLLQEVRRVFNCNLLRNLIIDSGRLAILSMGVYLVWQGSITVGSLVFIFTISEKSLISLFRISRLYDRIMESSEAVERLYELSLEESSIRNPENGLAPKKIEGEIEFRNVAYCYKESGINALDGICLKIPSGAVTAFVGPSGGGKTTLARMIYRHYDPDKGEVLLDGKNLKDYDLFGFRKFMAIVPQEVEIFNTTIKGNIAYANPKATFEEIQAAAKIANAEEFISQFKVGYDTLVGERGMKLSGGQRQRIGIARAILANPRILIFDEATSNLDSQSERLIQDAMDKISKNRTVILIAHRLSTIKKADKIVVLERGKVVEEGSHIELAKSEGGLYQKLLALQKMGDVE